jgi:hypothetical protein
VRTPSFLGLEERLTRVPSRTRMILEGFYAMIGARYRGWSDEAHAKGQAVAKSCHKES